MAQLSASAWSAPDVPTWVDAEVASDAAGPFSALPNTIAPLDPTWRVVGPALTALTWRDDNAVVQELLQGGPHIGYVLVVAGAAASRSSVIGDVTARQLRAAGFTALVTDGPVRDVAAIRTIGFPVWCAGATTVASSKQRPGHIGVPVSLGGVVVRPGDLVIASSSGVTVWAAAATEELLVAARYKHDVDEARVRELTGASSDTEPGR